PGAGAAAQLALRRRLGFGCLLGRLGFLGLLRRPGQPLATQADLAIGRVHTQDLDLDFVADLNHVLGTFNLVVGQLRDVQQPFQPRLQLDEHAEVRQLGYLALLDLVGLVTAGDVALPRIVVHLFQAQGDALALLIDVEHDARHLVALADDLAGMGHLAHPAHVADVQETVDALLDLDEGAVVGQVAHHAADDRVRRIALGHLVPRIGLHLLHAQGDFLLLLVDVEDLHLDLIADGDQLAGVVDALGPAHLADVHQALDARLQLDEGAVAHDVDHLAGMTAAHRVLVGGAGPRAGRLLLQAQGDLLPLPVHLDDEHFELLIDVNHVMGV